MNVPTRTVRFVRREAAMARSLARSAVYRLLSQALSYPTDEAVASLLETEVPQALQATGRRSGALAAGLDALARATANLDASALQREHRRVLGHTISMDCPPCETFYTAPDIFRETQELSDIGGFLRAFGLRMAEGERPDHITVELEFLHFLTYKEAHALAHHGPAQSRLCRDAQRKFMRDHLGRWGSLFAERLAQKSGGGFYASVASLLEAFLSTEMDLLRVRANVVPAGQGWRTAEPEDSGCPLAAEDGSLPCV